MHSLKQVHISTIWKDGPSTCTYFFFFLAALRIRGDTTNLQNFPLLDKEAENKQNKGSKGLRNFRSLYASKVTDNHYTKGKSCSGNKIETAPEVKVIRSRSSWKLR